MKATFNINVNIDGNDVSTSFNSEKNEDMNIILLTSILKIFSDVQNKVKSQVAKYYGIQKEQNDSETEENTNVEVADATAEQAE